MKNKFINASIAYLIWGSFPLYWKQLEQVPALQILGHRVVWSFLFLMLLLTLQRGWSGLLQGVREQGRLYALAGLVLGFNWLLYVWGVNSGQIIETSLGSFMTSLFTVLFGVIFLKEKLRLFQWIPIVFMCGSVIYLTIEHGTFPWLAVSLGASFSLYTLLKKKASLEPLLGLTIETGFLFLPCLVLLIVTDFQGNGAFGHSELITDLLLAGGGIITGLPLLLFARAVQAIPLWLMGLFQYIPPTMFFYIGVFIYQEPVSIEKMIVFCIIWLAIFLFWLEGIIWQKRQRKSSFVCS